MNGKKVNPWQCPPDPQFRRIVHLDNLPPDCTLAHLYPFLVPFHEFDQPFMFGNQALIQFSNPQKAQAFVQHYQNKLVISGHPIDISFSPLTQLVFTGDSSSRQTPSRVICIQVTKLRVCLGIQDIYDECSLFGIVEKIICFEKTGKFALVKMNKVEQATLALINLTNSARHQPSFNFRIQYSKNQDIVIKFNNSKSFDFTTTDSHQQFARLREEMVGERPFFTVDECEGIDPLFDFWRPVYFDPFFLPVLSVANFDDKFVTCDFLKNLFSQYGVVEHVKISNARRRFALIKFSNSFYARLALTFMENLPIDGKKLIIDFQIHPDLTPQSDQLSKDYSSKSDEDFEIDDYSSLSFPSRFVKIKNGNPEDLNIPTNADFDPKSKIIQFPTIDEATRFIGMMNTTVVNGKTVYVSFCNPY